MTTPPTVLGGRYELGDVIGQGGMATVLSGRDLRLGRMVAIKLLRTDLIADKTFAARFRQEAFAVASLNHPRIVAVYDTGEQDINGTVIPYIVMEYVEGQTLSDVRDDTRRILPERAMEITADVLDALEYSHRAGIVHRDIKPGNVMLAPGGTVKVMDFGIARAVDSATMTATRTVVGTANYLSPEQARGETVDNRSDIYSTGCLLYELLTGQPPFTADTPIAVIYQHVGEEPRPPGIRRDIDAVVLNALIKDPRQRYQSAAEMRGDLLRVLDGVAPLGPSPARDTGQRAAAGAAMAAGGPRGGGPTGERTMESAMASGPPADPEAARRRKLTYVGLVAALLALLVAAAFVVPGLFGNPDGSSADGNDPDTSPSSTPKEKQEQNVDSSPSGDGDDGTVRGDGEDDNDDDNSGDDDNNDDSTSSSPSSSPSDPETTPSDDPTPTDDPTTAEPTDDPTTAEPTDEPSDEPSTDDSTPPSDDEDD